MTTADCCMHTWGQLSSLLTLLAGRKNYTRPITRYYNLLGFPIKNKVWFKLETLPFWAHFTTSRDKAKWQRQNCFQETVGRIDFKFSTVFFVALVRTKPSSFEVIMVWTTKCSQEEKVCLTAVVFYFVCFFLVVLVLKESLSRSECICKYFFWSVRIKRRNNCLLENISVKKDFTMFIESDKQEFYFKLI